MENMIEVTGVDLVKLVQQAYALSHPQGLGFIHYQDGDLPEADAKAIIDREKPEGRIAASMDYVKGRGCKMTVFRQDGKLFIKEAWFDHSAAQLRTLLERIGMPDKTPLVREWA
jgi:hypothetical protein